MPSIDELQGDDADAIGRLATGHGAAKDDLSNVENAALLAKAIAAGVIAAAVSAALAAVSGSSPLSFTNVPAASATANSAYSYTPVVSGGTAPYTFALTGALPAGLAFSTSTGAITGSPTVAGTTTGLSIAVTDAADATKAVTFAITVTAAVSGMTTLFHDDGTKPLSPRIGTPVTANGVTWGKFSQRAMESGLGNYTTFEWTEGYATADPYPLITKRDDQTVVPNFPADAIKSTGYMPVVRDTAAGVTTFRVRKRSGTNLASTSGIANTETRADGSFLGAMLNTQHSLFGPPPYEITVTGINDPSGILELWDAIWVIQQDSHQSTTLPSERVDLGPNGGHDEIDFWERTGLASTANKVFTNQLYNAATGTDTSLKSNGGVYVDLGEVVADTTWDMRATVTTTGVTIETKKSSDPTYSTIRSFTHPTDGRFATAPVYPQLDLKAGFRWNDQPSWVRSIDGNTPDFDWSWKTFTVRVPTANVAAWTNRTLDPSTIPAMSVTWAVTPSAIDNAASVGTTLATLTSVSGITYAAYGLSGAEMVGNAFKITGAMPSGSRDVTFWATRASDGAQFVVATQAVTVADNAVWWDAAAKVALNFETNQVRLLGEAGTWATYIDADGEPTATLKAMLPGFATTGVGVWKGRGGATGYQGLYGYSDPTFRGAFAVQFLGSTLQCGFKDGAGTDKAATVSGMSTVTDAFGVAVSWASTGIKISGNGGAVTSSATAFATTSASAPLLWSSGFGDAAFAGTKQRLFLYDPDAIGGSAGALVSDAILQGKATHA